MGVCRIGWVRQVKAKQGLLTPRYAVTLEEAKAQFQKSWDVWKAWAKAGRRQKSVAGYDAFGPGNETGTNRDELVAASLAARAAASSRSI